MQLVKILAAILPASFKSSFQQRPDSLAIFLPKTVDKVDIGQEEFAVGIEQCKQTVSPLKGNIIHFSHEPEAYFVAAGRNAKGEVDYTLPAVVDKLEKVLSESFREYPEFCTVLDSLASCQNKSLDQLISDVAESANELSNLRSVLAGPMMVEDLPSNFAHCLRWIESNLGQWRLRAYYQTSRPLFWLLDCHRYGSRQYSRSGTVSGNVGKLFDEAVWVPDDQCLELIEALAVEKGISVLAASEKFLDTMLMQYNAYLKHQVFRVHIQQATVVNGLPSWKVIDTSGDCYGYPAAQHQKEVSLQKLWHIKLILITFLQL